MPKYDVLVDNELCRLELEQHEGVACLHWPRLRWGVREYKEYLKIFPTVKEYVKGLGYDRITVFLDKEDKRAKLIKMFGFEKVDEGVYELWVSPHK